MVTDAVRLAATVLVPTHDHGPTLLRSVPTALSQDVEDIEVIIVGDGVPPAGREAARQLVDADPRVRFLDNPKGRRHGEEHRHRALAQARGEVVLYLCDDDLWRPGHIATMRELLRDADFAHTLAVAVDGDGKLFTYSGDLALSGLVARMHDGRNFIPLSCAGHTLEIYRRLPYGWYPAPPDVPTDLHFFQQLLRQPGCRTRSSHLPTVVHFPTPLRLGWSGERRLAELDSWYRVVADEESWTRVVLDLLAAVSRARASAGEELAEAQRGRRETEAALAVTEAKLVAMRRTATWRLHDRLIALPLARRTFGRVVQVLAGRRGL